MLEKTKTDAKFHAEEVNGIFGKILIALSYLLIFIGFPFRFDFFLFSLLDFISLNLKYLLFAVFAVV
jgi:hypothetical protein